MTEEGVDVMRELGQALNRDIAKGEAVEAEIDAFISRRDAERRKSDPERELEAVWRASERVQEARRREELDAAWHRWHLSRAEGYAARSREHEAKAEKYEKHNRKENAA